MNFESFENSPKMRNYLKICDVTPVYQHWGSGGKYEKKWFFNLHFVF